mgnify:CR=1 FL=1
MKHILCLLLALSLCAGTVFGTVACSDTQLPPTPDVSDTSGGLSGDSLEKFDYPDRRTESFDSLAYTRPDMIGLVASYSSLTTRITDGATATDVIDELRALATPTETAVTMYTLAGILTNKDTTDESKKGEYDYISSQYPLLLQAAEKLYVACANSADAENFEKLWYGDGLVEKYRGGGVYTDEVIGLMQDEAEYESRYNALTESSVTVTYKGRSDTAANLMETYKNSWLANRSLREIRALAQKKLTEERTALLVSLVQTRIRLATALGYDSYADYAYTEYDRDYSPADMEAFLAAIKTYVLPVYANRDLQIALSYYRMTPFTTENGLSSTEKTQEVLYTLYGNRSAKMQNVLHFLLQYKLCDVAPAGETRYDGSYTTYLYSYDAPFIFLSTEGTVQDCLTFAHELGHAADMYAHGQSTVLDLAEVYSELNECLTLLSLSGSLSTKEYTALVYNKMESWFKILLYQGFYAKFEHLVYRLPADAVTAESIADCVAQAGDYFGMSTDGVESVFIPHIFLYPFYVQSYCLAAATVMPVTLDTHGGIRDGWKVLDALLSSDIPVTDRAEALQRAAVDDPMKNSAEILKETANRIYFRALGKYFYSSDCNSPGGC